MLKRKYKKGDLIYIFSWDKKMYPAIFFKEELNGWSKVIGNLNDYGLRICSVHESSLIKP